MGRTGPLAKYFQVPGLPARGFSCRISTHGRVTGPAPRVVPAGLHSWTIKSWRGKHWRVFRSGKFVYLLEMKFDQFPRQVQYHNPRYQARQQDLDQWGDVARQNSQDPRSGGNSVWSLSGPTIPRYFQTGSTSLDLSGSETMSTDSQISANMAANSSSSSSNVSRRLSNNDSGLFPDSPVSLPLRLRSPREKSTSEAVPNSSQARRASIEDLSDFLSKMDSSIAVNTKTSISLIKSSKIEEKEGEVSRNNTNSRLSEGYSTEEEMSQSFRKNFNSNVK